jgi:hypothetical protein
VDEVDDFGAAALGRAGAVAFGAGLFGSGGLARAVSASCGCVVAGFTSADLPAPVDVPSGAASLEPLDVPVGVSPAPAPVAATVRTDVAMATAQAASPIRRTTLSQALSRIAATAAEKHIELRMDDTRCNRTASKSGE